MRAFFREKGPGMLVCLALALPAWWVGKQVPIMGGPVVAIVAGMLVGMVWKDKGAASPGIRFTGKKVLQWAVVLLGFGLNLNVVLQTGRQSLPIILATISMALGLAWLLQRLLKMDANLSTLVGVGSAICGGSAIAATAPVIDVKEEEVAQAISVIFFFNVLAALLFPALGRAIGFAADTGEAFGLFAGTAVNDTSSVTAAASAWDSMWNLGSATLDKAVTVKLTRTLFILPITLGLALLRAGKQKGQADSRFRLTQVFPTFILYFILASLLTTLAGRLGVDAAVFQPLKELSKFLIVMAMAAIGLNTDIIKLLKTGGKPLLLGACCWIGITLTSLALQKWMGIF